MTDDRTYYTLVSIPHKNAPDAWCIEFGDYARNVVRDEMNDRKYDDRLTFKRGERPQYRILRHRSTEQRVTVDAINKIEGRV